MVIIDEKFNDLLDEIVASGINQSKAELMESSAVYLLMEMGLLKDHIKGKKTAREK